MTSEKIVVKTKQRPECPACREPIHEHETVVYCSQKHAGVHEECLEMISRCPVMGCDEPLRSSSGDAVTVAVREVFERSDHVYQDYATHDPMEAFEESIEHLGPRQQQRHRERLREREENREWNNTVDEFTKTVTLWGIVMVGAVLFFFYMMIFGKLYASRNAFDNLKFWAGGLVLSLLYMGFLKLMSMMGMEFR